MSSANEHIGDAAIMLAARLYLFDRFPNVSANRWQRLLSDLCSNRVLGMIARAEKVTPCGGKNADAAGLEVKVGRLALADFSVAKSYFWELIDKYNLVYRTSGGFVELDTSAILVAQKKK